MTDNAVTRMEQRQDAKLTADPMVSMIERVVMDPNADLDKLERMLAMKERMDAETARRQFSDAMAACQSDMQPVAKNKNNDQTRSKYADLAAIYAACKPIIGQHGFSFSTFPGSSEKPGYMGVRWTLRHQSGHEESGVAEIPIDDKGMKGTANKTQTHAFGSTVSYARRYLFCMIFDIATGEDSDGNTTQASAEPITEEQFRELQDMVERAGITDAIVCQAERIESLHLLPAASFAKVKSNLQVNIDRREKDND